MTSQLPLLIPIIILKGLYSKQSLPCEGQPSKSHLKDPCIVCAISVKAKLKQGVYDMQSTKKCSDRGSRKNYLQQSLAHVTCQLKNFQ